MACAHLPYPSCFPTLTTPPTHMPVSCTPLPPPLPIPYSLPAPGPSPAWLVGTLPPLLLCVYLSAIMNSLCCTYYLWLFPPPSLCPPDYLLPALPLHLQPSFIVVYEKCSPRVAVLSHIITLFLTLLASLPYIILPLRPARYYLTPPHPPVIPA